MHFDNDDQARYANDLRIYTDMPLTARLEAEGAYGLLTLIDHAQKANTTVNWTDPTQGVEAFDAHLGDIPLAKGGTYRYKDQGLVPVAPGGHSIVPEKAITLSLWALAEEGKTGAISTFISHANTAGGDGPHIASIMQILKDDPKGIYALHTSVRKDITTMAALDALNRLIEGDTRTVGAALHNVAIQTTGRALYSQIKDVFAAPHKIVSQAIRGGNFTGGGDWVNWTPPGENTGFYELYVPHLETKIAELMDSCHDITNWENNHGRF